LQDVRSESSCARLLLGPGRTLRLRPRRRDRAQTVDIMTRIDRRRHAGAVAQHVADLVKRRTLAQHVGCKAVAEQVRANILLWGLETGILERLLECGIEDLSIHEGLMRRRRGDE